MSDNAPPQQPYPPQGYYPPQPPPKKKHTLRNVLLVLLAIGVLFIGGCALLFGAAVNEVDKAVTESAEKDAEPGGPDNPLEITEGEAFEVSGFDYADGWTIKNNADLDLFEIDRLRVTNNRDSSDSALVEIKFNQGSEVLASVDCTSDDIAVGQTVTLNCISADALPADYDTITINDTF
ncbi:MAG: hypothetical protein Q7T56_15900 [Nocardioidaceae bacterium]|nr:hypothetical protein [Nocardioidaceae bacterium]